MELNVSDRENRIYKGPEAGERRWGRGSGQSKFSITRALSEDGVRGNDNEKKKNGGGAVGVVSGRQMGVFRSSRFSVRGLCIPSGNSWVHWRDLSNKVT